MGRVELREEEKNEREEGENENEGGEEKIK